MGTRVKVQDFVDVAERDWPNLVFVGTVHKGPKPVLHICRRDGYKSHPKRRRGWHYHITNCTRAIQHTFYFRNSTYAGWDKFRLCTRCGTKADFEEAFAEMLAGWEARQAELYAERGAEEAARQLAWQGRHARIRTLQGVIEGASGSPPIPMGSFIDVGFVEDDQNFFYVYHHGIRFRIEEDPDES